MEILERNEKMIREEWFKDHVIKKHETYDEGKLETLEWGKPGTSSYAVWYVRQYGTLMVGIYKPVADNQ